ncbi:Triple repetitive-sequence of QXXK/R protein [Trinorchestia longiramus]|nr:Triple repetitive-sequence of QXXK/R protein [Trinorchestia longiramus]
MGKKDQMTQAPPVAHYRKEIGRQNKKQGSVVVKLARHQAEIKTAKVKMHQEFRLVAVGCVVAVAAVYALLYIWLQ